MLPMTCLLACSRGAEVTRGADERLGPGVWSVNGIAIGATRDEVEARLGPGEQVGYLEHAPVYRFGQRAVAVTFDREARVAGVSGDTLLRDGQPMLEVGQGADAIVPALGEGYVVEHFTPTTSGVFTTGSVPGSAEHGYHDGTTRFEVFVNHTGSIGGIHARALGGSTGPNR